MRAINGTRIDEALACGDSRTGNVILSVVECLEMNRAMDAWLKRRGQETQSIRMMIARSVWQARRKKLK
jgi:hypothetical protein